MEKHDPLNRTCNACGLQKPLSAFLQITNQGTVYGYICSTCRSAGITEKPKTLQDEEHGSNSSGARIGTKQRVHMEKEQKREFKELKDKRLEETKKREEIAEKKTERLEHTDSADKNRRKDLLESKKSFLSYQTKTAPHSWQSPATSKAQAEKAQQTVEAEKQEKSKEQEERLTKGGTFTDPNQALKVTTNATLRSYQISMGTSIGRQTLSQFKTPQSKTEPNSGKDPIKDYIDKTWEDAPNKPSSRKR